MNSPNFAAVILITNWWIPWPTLWVSCQKVHLRHEGGSEWSQFLKKNWGNEASVAKRLVFRDYITIMQALVLSDSLTPPRIYTSCHTSRSLATYNGNSHGYIWMHVSYKWYACTRWHLRMFCRFLSLKTNINLSLNVNQPFYHWIVFVPSRRKSRTITQPLVICEQNIYHHVSLLLYVFYPGTAIFGTIWIFRREHITVIFWLIWTPHNL